MTKKREYGKNTNKSGKAVKLTIRPGSGKNSRPSKVFFSVGGEQSGQTAKAIQNNDKQSNTSQLKPNKKQKSPNMEKVLKRYKSNLREPRPLKNVLKKYKSQLGKSEGGAARKRKDQRNPSSNKSKEILPNFTDAQSVIKRQATMASQKLHDFLSPKKKVKHEGNAKGIKTHVKHKCKPPVMANLVKKYQGNLSGHAAKPKGPTRKANVAQHTRTKHLLPKTPSAKPHADVQKYKQNVKPAALTKEKSRTLSASQQVPKKPLKLTSKDASFDIIRQVKTCSNTIPVNRIGRKGQAKTLHTNSQADLQNYKENIKQKHLLKKTNKTQLASQAPSIKRPLKLTSKDAINRIGRKRPTKTSPTNTHADVQNYKSNIKQKHLKKEKRPLLASQAPSIKRPLKLTSKDATVDIIKRVTTCNNVISVNRIGRNAKAKGNLAKYKRRLKVTNAGKGAEEHQQTPFSPVKINAAIMSDGKVQLCVKTPKRSKSASKRQIKIATTKKTSPLIVTTPQEAPVLVQGGSSSRNAIAVKSGARPLHLKAGITKKPKSETLKFAIGSKRQVDKLIKKKRHHHKP